MRTDDAGAVAALRASALSLRVNIAIVLTIASPWSPREIDRRSTMAANVLLTFARPKSKTCRALQRDRPAINPTGTTAQRIAIGSQTNFRRCAQRPINRATSAVSQNSTKEVMRPSRTSMKSATSVSTTSPVAIDSILTRPWTAALEPSITIETMV